MEVYTIIENINAYTLFLFVYSCWLKPVVFTAIAMFRGRETICSTNVDDHYRILFYKNNKNKISRCQIKI